MSKKNTIIDLSAIQSMAEFDEDAIQFNDKDLEDPSLLAELAAMTLEGQEGHTQNKAQLVS